MAVVVALVGPGALYRLEGVLVGRVVVPLARDRLAEEHVALGALIGARYDLRALRRPSLQEQA